MEGSGDRDEVDFEFVGKTMPGNVQTNLFVNGQGAREAIHPLGIDASADYHWYSIEYRANGVRWLVDGREVRSEWLDGTKNRVMPSRPQYGYMVRSCCF